jgi:hypothetical protein
MKLVSMEMKIITMIDWFIIFIIVVKLGFSMFYFLDKYLDLFGDEHQKEKYSEHVKYYRNITETSFNLFMAILILILFNPYLDIHINNTTRNLMFAYGVLLLLYIHWEELFPNSEIVKKTLNVVK